MDKTFTREQFDEAVKKASEKFLDTLFEEKGDDPDVGLKALAMGLQNIVFAGLIEKFLFGEKPSEDTTNVNEEKEGK